MQLATCIKSPTWERILQHWLPGYLWIKQQLFSPLSQQTPFYNITRCFGLHSLQFVIRRANWHSQGERKVFVVFLFHFKYVPMPKQASECEWESNWANNTIQLKNITHREKQQLLWKHGFGKWNIWHAGSAPFCLLIHQHEKKKKRWICRHIDWI